MNKIYVVYGQGPCGKSNFVRDIVLKNPNSLLEYGDLNTMQFHIKYKHEMKHFDNVIIDDLFPYNRYSREDRTKARNLVMKIFDYKDNFDNLFLVCHEKKHALEITDRLLTIEDLGKDVRIKFLDFGE